jgi:hypothetical protein
MIQYSNSQGGSMQIQMANQQQIGRPKLGSKKCVSDTTSNQKMQGFLHRSKRELWDRTNTSPSAEIACPRVKDKVGEDKKTKSLF